MRWTTSSALTHFYIEHDFFHYNRFIFTIDPKPLITTGLGADSKIPVLTAGGEKWVITTGNIMSR
jgi:hypothetical protein